MTLDNHRTLNFPLHPSNASVKSSDYTANLYAFLRNPGTPKIHGIVRNIQQNIKYPEQIVR